MVTNCEFFVRKFATLRNLVSSASAYANLWSWMTLTRGVDNPQLVFEAMGTRPGKKLSQADLIETSF